MGNITENRVEMGKRHLLQQRKRSNTDPVQYKTTHIRKNRRIIMTKKQTITFCFSGTPLTGLPEKSTNIIYLKEGQYAEHYRYQNQRNRFKQRKTILLYDCILTDQNQK